MKVKHLIEILEDADPEATVLICSQFNWPFEYSIGRAIIREEILENGEEPDRYEEGARTNDVLIVEGSQLRYGTKRAWEE